MVAAQTKEGTIAAGTACLSSRVRTGNRIDHVHPHLTPGGHSEKTPQPAVGQVRVGLDLPGRSRTSCYATKAISAGSKATVRSGLQQASSLSESRVSGNDRPWYHTLMVSYGCLCFTLHA